MPNYEPDYKNMTFIQKLLTIIMGVGASPRRSPTKYGAGRGSQDENTAYRKARKKRNKQALKNRKRNRKN
jgi:hypothetical protein